jgi:hypothetical protein
MKIKMILLSVLLGMIGSAGAGGRYHLKTGAYYQAEDILVRCVEGQEGNSLGNSNVLLNVCESYLAGSVDATYTWAELGYIPKKFCIPQAVTISQLRRIFVKYASENPERLHLKASSLSVEAFRMAFPCSSQSQVNYNYTAEDILSKCESKYSISVHRCRGYLSGVADAIDTWNAYEGLNKKICTPDGYASNTLRKIYTEYANKFPEVLHKSASNVALDLYRQVFTCK